MHCALYDAGRCRSCQWLERPVPQQLADKMADLRTLLAAIPVAAWGEPVSGPEAAFRNKAKMVVSGSVERPLLGMLHRDGTPVDLTDCPLYPAEFAPVFAALKPFIARAGLTPYNVARKRGELKYLLLTTSQQGEMMLRFVLRSEAKVAQLRAALPWLQAQLPQLSVITANIQPVHMAIMEGEQEIFFTEQQALGPALRDADDAPDRYRDRPGSHRLRQTVSRAAGAQQSAFSGAGLHAVRHSRSGCPAAGAG